MAETREEAIAREVRQLVAETDDYDDALGYVADIPDDLLAEGWERVELDEVVTELRRQLGLPEKED